MPHTTLPAYGDVTDHLKDFYKMANEAGRSADPLPITLWGGNPNPEKFKLWQDCGITRAILPLGSSPKDQLIEEVDQLAEWSSSLNY